jgi:acylphosphatase
MGIGKVHVWITGRVQGVFFRYRTHEEALKLGLNGWVRNLPDGRVEAVFQGDEPSLKEMLRWCHWGPSTAFVKNVETTWEDPDPEIRDFKIRYR